GHDAADIDARPAANGAEMVDADGHLVAGDRVAELEVGELVVALDADDESAQIGVVARLSAAEEPFDVGGGGVAGRVFAAAIAQVAAGIEAAETLAGRRGRVGAV